VKTEDINKHLRIKYDKDFEKVMNELQSNFGWSNIDVLPDSYKDLLNDTIKAVKNCSITSVSVSSCDCTHNQACKICGSKKRLDGDFWDMIAK
jgi:hypothetical protein